MNEKSDLPEGWEMPDYMARKVSKSINRKRLTPEDELQDAFSELANDLRLIEPDPSDWSWWVGYLLEQMEIQAKNRRTIKQFEYTLEVLEEKIQK
jgi:hypothetical protein